MDQVVKAASPQELARAQAVAQKQAEAADVAAKAAPVFVGNKERALTVSLEFPVEWDGKVYSEVVIRRPTMREWRKYMRDCADAVAANGPNADDNVDQPWLSIPAVVFEALDFIDASKVEAAQEGFFGRSSLPEGMESGSKPVSEAGEPLPSS